MQLELTCRRCGRTYIIDRRDLIAGAWRTCPSCRDPKPPGAVADRPTVQPPRRVLEPEAAA